ncbi:ribosomal RNA small subunit methyltransferase A [Myxococcota bacterium]|nr:ribosomal RNA small subunit methyltransferase A [Myxococcota bacterium]
MIPGPPPPERRTARKELGQHFLTHERDARRIVEALDPRPGDTVLEIGPGPGALTRHLVPRCGRLLLLEKDPRFVADLRDRYGDSPRVEVIEGDATEPDLARWLSPGIRVVGNLPYNAGTAILMNLLESRDRLARVVVMLQQEVAERLVAAPGSRARGSLSLRVQARAGVALRFRVPPGHFVPPPAVWSAVVVLDPAGADPEAAEAASRPSFDALAQALFAQPRKTVVNSLADGTRLPRERIAEALARVPIDPGIRPSMVTQDAFLGLWRELGS